MGGALALARNLEIESRIEIFELEQFVSLILHKQSLFERARRVSAIGEFVQAYNDIIELCETDPSLKICLS